MAILMADSTALYITTLTLPTKGNEQDASTIGSASHRCYNWAVKALQHSKALMAMTIAAKPPSLAAETSKSCSQPKLFPLPVEELLHVGIEVPDLILRSRGDVALDRPAHVTS